MAKDGRGAQYPEANLGGRQIDSGRALLDDFFRPLLPLLDRERRLAHIRLRPGGTAHGHDREADKQGHAKPGQAAEIQIGRQGRPAHQRQVQETTHDKIERAAQQPQIAQPQEPCLGGRIDLAAICRGARTAAGHRRAGGVLPRFRCLAQRIRGPSRCCRRRGVGLLNQQQAGKEQEEGHDVPVPHAQEPREFEEQRNGQKQ